MREMAQWLAARDDIVVLGHRAPDGDACGSCIAVAMCLRALGKRACVCLPDGVPEYLRFLPGQECLAEEGNLPFAPQTALAVDVSSPDMLSQYRALFEACPHRAVLDHHQSNPLFGQVNCVQPGSAAAGELALALIEALGVALTREMATCIFAAVCSDTGNFNFSNTTAEAFEAAATCVRAGADVDEITGRIFRTRTQARTRLLGMALSSLRFDGRMAWTSVTNQMFAACGAQRSDTERIVNYLAEIEGAQVAVLAIEQEGGASTKFSLRSVAPYDVARDVAQPLGGGGHERAAGVTISLPLEEALAKVLDRARKML